MLSACSGQMSPPEGTTTVPSDLTLMPSPSVMVTPSITPNPSPSLTPVPSPTPRPYSSRFHRTPEPPGCQEPPEDYTLVSVAGFSFNRRTVAMLAVAQSLYDGEIDVTQRSITQGSYHDNGAASFGTHLGGGAVDLSVMRPGTYEILNDDIEPLIHALRVAGFAAWLRDFDEVYPGSAIHIHAIAIGDQRLSSAAVLQLTGPTGYFRGMTGLPENIATPSADRHGGPILCDWMVKRGYRDLRRPTREIP